MQIGKRMSFGELSTRTATGITLHLRHSAKRASGRRVGSSSGLAVSQLWAVALGLLLPPSAAMANSLKVVVAADDSDGYETMVLGAGAGTLCVVDVYNSWCGPCEALSRKIGTLFNELGEFDIKFVQAKADAIKALAEFADPVRP